MLELKVSKKKKKARVAAPGLAADARDGELAGGGSDAGAAASWRTRRPPRRAPTAGLLLAARSGARPCSGGLHLRRPGMRPPSPARRRRGEARSAGGGRRGSGADAVEDEEGISTLFFFFGTLSFPRSSPSGGASRPPGEGRPPMASPSACAVHGRSSEEPHTWPAAEGRSWPVHVRRPWPLGEGASRPAVRAAARRRSSSSGTGGTRSRAALAH
ncbi:unnamed protein product [Urochloa humidicola]